MAASQKHDRSWLTFIRALRSGARYDLVQQQQTQVDMDRNFVYDDGTQPDANTTHLSHRFICATDPSPQALSLRLTSLCPNLVTNAPIHSHDTTVSDVNAHINVYLDVLNGDPSEMLHII